MNLLNSASAAVMLHKLAIVRFAFFSVNALCAAIIGALAGTEWGNADKQTRFLIVIAVVLSWTNTMMAFFDKTSQRLAEGKDPAIPEGSTTPPQSQPPAQ